MYTIDDQFSWCWNTIPKKTHILSRTNVIARFLNKLCHFMSFTLGLSWVKSEPEGLFFCFVLNVNCGLCALAECMRPNSTPTQLYVWGNNFNEESGCIVSDILFLLSVHRVYVIFLIPPLRSGNLKQLLNRNLSPALEQDGWAPHAFIWWQNGH